MIAPHREHGVYESDKTDVGRFVFSEKLRELCVFVVKSSLRALHFTFST